MLEWSLCLDIVYMLVLLGGGLGAVSLILLILIFVFLKYGIARRSKGDDADLVVS